MNGNHEESENLDKNLKIGLILNTGFTVFEFIIGFMSGSLALISDAAHNLTDSLALVISFSANRIANRQANMGKTYGYGRATIMAAMINTIILFVLAGYIFYEAYLRIQNPQPVEGKLVMMVAFVGIIINGAVAALFFKNRRDLNIKSAFLNMFFDMVASIGALIAGLVITLTNQTVIDPLISILIGLMLIFGAWGVSKDALHILLDGVPTGLDLEKVRQTILNTSNVKGIDDLHIWALSTKEAALSCHIVINDCTLKESIDLTEKIKEHLHKKFHIEHATIEIEITQGPHHNESPDEGV